MSFSVPQYAPITVWGGTGKVPSSYMDRPIPTNEYLSVADLDDKTRESVESTSRATGVIKFGRQIKANAILISPTLVLVDSHAFNENVDKLAFSGIKKTLSGRVLFDGYCHSNIRTDFKIIQIQPILDRDPVVLSVSTSGFGRRVQFSYDDRGIQYLKVYEKPYPGQYATKADKMATISWKGECGSPRLDLGVRAVCSIHQGERLGFTINQMVMSLEQATHEHKSISAFIISHLAIPDMQLRYMNNTVIGLDPGAVEEEVRVPASEAFIDYLTRVAYSGTDSVGDPVYQVRFNHILRYLRAYQDSFIDQEIQRAFESNGLPYIPEMETYLSKILSYRIAGKIPSSSNANIHENGISSEVRNQYKKTFNHLYSLCLRVSEGSLVEGKEEYVDPNFSLSKIPNISKKFRDDHIVEFPSKKRRIDHILEIAYRRAKDVATLIDEREIKRFGQEIADTNYDYVFSEIQKYINKRQCAVNILFCTQNNYKYFEARKSTMSNGSVKYEPYEIQGKFLFTVEKRGETYYAYHYEKSLEDYLSNSDPTKTVKIRVGQQIAYLEIA